MIIECHIKNDRLFIQYETGHGKCFKDITWNLFKKNDLVKRYGTEVLMDLLHLSVFVYAADRAVSRDAFMDSWTRRLELVMPVRDINLWNSVKQDLTKMLEFLTGDIWNFSFTNRREHLIQDATVEMRDHYGYVSLLSGGLDSFIGAIDILEANHLDTVFLSWYGGGKSTRPTQTELQRIIANHYHLNEESFAEFYLSIKCSEENTMRSRSFFLLTHALAMCYEKLTVKNRILVPENGFISLNPPLTDARLGSSTTKTTHPFFIRSMNALLSKLGFEVIIENPYRFYTKGQMLLNCKNQLLLSENIDKTISCAHPDRANNITKHCGYCWPCVIRRAAIKRSGLVDKTIYGILREVQVSVQKKLKPYKMFLSDTCSLSPEFLLMKTGPISDNYEKYANIIKAGIDEIKEIID